jgi:hypothetical protein
MECRTITWKEDAMTTKKLLSAFVVGLLLVGWGMIDVALAGEREVQSPGPRRGGGQEANPEVLIFETLGNANASDVYKVTCSSSSSRCVRADVCDEGPFFDTNFKVVVTVPGNNGTSTRTSGVGGCSSLASSCRSFSSNSLRGIVVIQEVNLAGAEDYSTFIDCANSSGGSVGHSVSKIRDE